MTTLDHINTLRSLAESLSCITTHDWSDEARAVEAAADHLEVLATQLCTAEDDIARLNDEVEAAEHILDRLAQWVQYARAALPNGSAAFPLPSEFYAYQKVKEPTPNVG